MERREYILMLSHLCKILRHAKNCRCFFFSLSHFFFFLSRWLECREIITIIRKITYSIHVLPLTRNPFEIFIFTPTSSIQQSTESCETYRCEQDPEAITPRVELRPRGQRRIQSKPNLLWGSEERRIEELMNRGRVWFDWAGYLIHLVFVCYILLIYIC